MTLLALVVIDIDDFNIGNCNNHNDVRGYMMSSSKPSTRAVSMSSSEALVNYATQIE